MKPCTCDLVEHNGDINNRVGGDSIAVSISYSTTLVWDHNEKEYNELSVTSLWKFWSSSFKENTVVG